MGAQYSLHKNSIINDSSIATLLQIAEMLLAVTLDSNKASAHGF